MPYIQRDPKGQISSITQTLDEQHQEYLPPTNQEIITFLTQIDCGHLAINALEESDKNIARATEDLIHLLISKNAILNTELPEAVQQKLLGRAQIRSQLNGLTDNFLDDGELL